jgi:hypothetical protein
MNFITWNKAYCPFLAAKIQQRESYMVGDLNEDDDFQLIGLAADGIKTMSVTWLSGNWLSYQKSITGLRRIGDKHTLTIDLNAQGVVPSKKPDGVIESGTFKLRLFDKNIDAVNGLEFVRHYVFADPILLEHPVLKYDYLMSAEVHGNPSLGTIQVHELKTFLNELAKIELIMMHRCAFKRSPQYQQIIKGEIEPTELEGKFPLRGTWTYYDDEVIRFLKEAWEDRDDGEEREMKGGKAGWTFAN